MADQTADVHDDLCLFYAYAIKNNVAQIMLYFGRNTVPHFAGIVKDFGLTPYY